MAPPLLTLKDIHLTFGGTPLMVGVDLQVRRGDRIGLVGRNGSGKSTLLKIAAGLINPDAGERFIQPGLRVDYLSQEPDLSKFETVLSYVESAFAPGEDPYRARIMLAELGLSADAATSTLSGGESRRAALARALAREPDLLLLDEPTNHLDLPAIEWLEREVSSLSSAVVLISHDRRFLETLTRTILWLDRGQSRLLDKGFGAFERWRDEILEHETLARHKLDRQIAREEDWMQGGVTARRKRNVRRVGELAALRKAQREARRQLGTVTLESSYAGASGRLVIEATGVAKKFDDVVVAKDFTLRIARGDRLGLVGPNGVGKTTLLRLLLGDIEPDVGTIRRGSNLEVVTLDQKRDALDPQQTLAEALTGGRGDTVMINGRPRHVASFMKDFLFLPEQRGSPLRVLSGGERARVLLARAMARASNLLVLDEPTNDLDIETLDLLQELIGDYAGTVILVSHDRDFLDRTVTSLLVGEGDGTWMEYAGGYSDMLAQRGSGVTAKKRPVSSKTDEKGSFAQAVSAQTRKIRRKLSYKESRTLDRLPDDIEVMAVKIAQIEHALADPELFARDALAFRDLSEQLAELLARKQDAEDQWFELELKREELED
ncbi:MAG: ABC-F family ATP-binding cassette domain-containing protein [Hyphomicrobiaceae bacterium]